MSNYVAIDLFSGCGGLSEGMRQAEFLVKAAIEIDADAVLAYRMNQPKTEVLEMDIREIKPEQIVKIVGNKTIHLLAGCPPCQGFSSVRRLNRKRSVRDERNKLIWEYLRFVRELKPLTLMLENVKGIVDYYTFGKFIKDLRTLGYNIKYDVVNIQYYGVPQRRKRLVLVGSRLGEIEIVRPTNERMTVRDAIGKMEPIEKTEDPLHKVVVKHTRRIREMIGMIPKNGGSRTDLPDKYTLKCHRKDNVGFNDVYGRLRWDDYSNTITAGCLNPSKGRFLHPEENRVITPREAALIQTFPPDYKFPLDIGKASLANMIGEALPPKFSYIQSKGIKSHLDEHLCRTSSR